MVVAELAVRLEKQPGSEQEIYRVPDEVVSNNVCKFKNCDALL